MLKRPLEDYLGYEQDYPDFIEMVIRYENAVLPLCAHCGSAERDKAYQRNSHSQRQAAYGYSFQKKTNQNE